MSKVKWAAIVVGSAVALGLVYYVFSAPYTRFPGVRIGGELTAAPGDWGSVNGGRVALLKLDGFPPFVIHVWYVAEGGGIITATRPDNGYWARRVRTRPNGWLRIGDRTYALSGKEVVGEARIPYLEKYGAKYKMPMRYDFNGEIIPGVNEPLHTWEVFYWTAR
ncbi:MAG: hypothetical protein FJW22_02255 [Acidimicrobiia bacterium]|nr:hypothetical protein [Acidimicrobiia bacterium]